MSSPPSDPALAAAIERIRGELEAMRQRVGALAAENGTLHDRLERCEAAREDLAAQARHLLDLLGESRREVWSLQPPPPA